MERMNDCITVIKMSQTVIELHAIHVFNELNTQYISTFYEHNK